MRGTIAPPIHPFTPTVDERSRFRSDGRNATAREKWPFRVLSARLGVTGEALAKLGGGSFEMQRPAATASLPLLLASCALFSCSSGDFKSASTSDAGTDDSGADSTVVDTSDATIEAGCILPPAATGAEGEFCRALASYYSRCKHCEDCVQTNVNACISFGTAVSKLYKNAFIACKDDIKCDGDLNTIASDPCVLTHFSPSDLSAKQIEARDKYCSTCPSNKYECDNYFGKTDDAGADGGTAGIGGYVIIAGDDTVQTIINDCTNPVGCNPGAYVLCTLAKFCGPFPHDACGSKFCGK